MFSQERQRRYLSLSPWDKATLSLVRLQLTFRRLLGPRRRRASSSCLCLSGSCDSLQQDGEDRGVLLHPVPALLGVPGTWAGVWCCTVSKSTSSPVLSFQVLYKTAWSESIGRDCTAFCAKKSDPLSSDSVRPFLQTRQLSSFSVVSVPTRYADHLHQFHENDPNL